MTNFLNSSENRYDDFIREALRHLDNRSISEMSDICGNAVKLVKDRCEAYFLLSIAAFLLDDLGRALELAQKGHEIDPDCQEGNDILAHLLAHAGHIEESVFHAKLVSVGYPNLLLMGISIEGLDNLPKAMNEPQGSSYRIDAARALAQGKYSEAVLGFEKELRVRSGDSVLFRQFAMGLRGIGEPQRAVPAVHAAIQMETENFENYLELGTAYLECGDQALAFGCFNQALVMSGGDSKVLSDISLLRSKIHFHWPKFDTKVRRWLKDNALQQKTSKNEKKRKGVRSNNKGDKNEVARIGFLFDRATQCDMLRILEPLLLEYDRFTTEVFVYSTDVPDDPTPKRLKDLVSEWVNIANLNDNNVIERIKFRKLDVLIDLCVTSVGQRPGVIAQHPSRRVYRWLGCESGIFNGLYDDWRSDAGIPHIDANQGILTIDPKFMPDVEGKSPYHTRGIINYGTIADVSLLSPAVTMCWARILRDDPTSELVLGVKERISSSVQARLTEYFSTAGILDRVRFEKISYTEEEGIVVGRLKFLIGIDVYLDPFPQGSFIEILDALWAGVPIITMKENGITCSNAGYILKSTGYGEFVAKNERNYVSAAINAAKTVANNPDWRGSMHDQIKESPLFDQSQWRENYRRLINSLM